MLETDSPKHSSTGGRSLGSTSYGKVMRSPSAPDISSIRVPALTQNKMHFTLHSDPRLDRIKLADWDITFLSDDQFKLIITAYLAWDHPFWAFFDADDFCEALIGKPSELSSRLLVLAVLAYASVSKAGR